MYDKLISEMLIKDNFNNSFIGKAFSDDVMSDEDQKIIDQSENGNKVTEFFSSIGNMINTTFNHKRYGGKVYTYDFPKTEASVSDVADEIRYLLEARTLQGKDTIKSVSYLGKAIAYGMDNFSEEDIDLIIKNTDLDIEKSINEGIVITERKQSTKNAVSGLRRPDPKEETETEEVEEVEPETEEPIEEPIEPEEEIADVEEVEDEIESEEPEEEIEVEKDGNIDLVLTIDEELTLSEYELGKMFMVEIDLVFTEKTSDTWKFSIFVGSNGTLYLWKIDTILKADTKKFYGEMLDLVTYIVNENWDAFQSSTPNKLLDIINMALTPEPMKYIKQPIVKFVNNTVSDKESVKKANMNYIILSSCVVSKNVNELGDLYLIATINGVLKSVVKKTGDGEYEIDESKMNTETLKKFMFACLKIDKTKKTLLFKDEHKGELKDSTETVDSEFLVNISKANPMSLSDFISEISTIGLNNLMLDNNYLDEVTRITDLSFEDEAIYKSERKKAYLKLISLLKNDMEYYITIPNNILTALETEEEKYTDMFSDIDYDLDEALKALTLLADTSTSNELKEYIGDGYIEELEESSYIPTEGIIHVSDLFKIAKDKTFYELSEDNPYIDGFIANYEDNFEGTVDETYRQAVNILFKKLLFELYDNEEAVTFDGYKMNDKIRNDIMRYPQYDNIYGNRVLSGELEGQPIRYDADALIDTLNILKGMDKSNELKSTLNHYV